MVSVLALAVLTGCQNSGSTAEPDATIQQSSMTESAQSSIPDNSESSAAIQDDSQLIVESSVDEVLEQESEDTVDSSETEVSENSVEDVSLPESSDERSESSEGYYFDDEQIVTHFHNAETFTNDDEFNELFSKNDIDAAYKTEMMDLNTVAEMREAAIKYGNIWKEEAAEAYEKLHEALAEMPEEQSKLELSQADWESSLTSAEESFQEEAQENGTMGLLMADNSMMNYYKGRAAVLYHQLYLLNGSFSMD